MKRILFLLLIGATVATASQTSPSTDSSSLFAPWKPQNRSTYRNPNAFQWNQGAGFTLSDFFGVEGSLHDLDYYESFRYNPGESGFAQDDLRTYNVVGVGQFPLTHVFAFFAKAGPSYQPNPAELDTITFPIEGIDEWGISYSTGARYKINPQLHLSLEYMRTENEMLTVESGLAQMSWNF